MDVREIYNLRKVLFFYHVFMCVFLVFGSMETAKEALKLGTCNFVQR